MDYEIHYGFSQSFHCRGNAASYCHYLFNMVDKDKKRTLNFTEYVLAMHMHESNDLEDSLGLVWTSFDSYLIISKRFLLNRHLTYLITTDLEQ